MPLFYTKDEYGINRIYSGPSLEGHPSRKDPNSWQQVAWMHVMLPLTKEHLSNKDKIVWQKECSYLTRVTVVLIHSWYAEYNNDSLIASFI